MPPDPLATLYNASPELFKAHATAPVDEGLRAQFPNSPELFQASGVPAAPAPPPSPAAPPSAADPAPAVYEFALPEGVAADEPALTPFRALAAEHQLKPETATALVQLYADQQKAEDAALDARWREASGKLLEGDGREAIATAAAYMPAETRQFLLRSGLGDHPAWVGWAVQVGRALNRQGTALGGPRSPAPADDPLRALYPNSPDLFRR